MRSRVEISGLTPLVLAGRPSSGHEGGERRLRGNSEWLSQRPEVAGCARWNCQKRGTGAASRSLLDRIALEPDLKLPSVWRTLEPRCSLLPVATH